MNVLETMRELAEKRAEKLTPVPLTKFFPVTDLLSMTWIGTFAWSNQETHKRWLVESVVTDLFGIPQIPPEIGRDYLRAKYTERRRMTTNQYQAVNEHRSAPLYAKVGHYENMALVDLKAAYWSILQIVGWDVDYSPSRWLGKRSDVADFPIPENKLARNSLVSVGLITKQSIWTGERLRNIKAHNPLVNYPLWACAQDILHSIASIALRAGAVHIHTDGFIIPNRHAALFIGEVSAWGLRALVKEVGDCTIYGIGSYDIGGRKTKHRHHTQSLNLNKVYEPDIAFLRPRIAKLARTKIDWSIPDGAGG